MKKRFFKENNTRKVLKIYYNEKNVSTIEDKKKKQTWF
jgi:hypothetical protein